MDAISDRSRVWMMMFCRRDGGSARDWMASSAALVLRAQSMTFMLARTRASMVGMPIPDDPPVTTAMGCFLSSVELDVDVGR